MWDRSPTLQNIAGELSLCGSDTSGRATAKQELVLPGELRHLQARGGDLGVKGQLGGAEFPMASLNLPLLAAPTGRVAAGVLVRWRARGRGGSARSPAGQQPGWPPAFPEYAKLFMCFSSAVWEGPRPSGFCWEPEGAGVLPLARHSRRGLGSRAGVMSHLQAAAVS